MAKKKKKTRHPGVYLLEDGRYLIRATVRCTRTTKMLESQRTLPFGTSLGQAIDALEALKADLRVGQRVEKQQRMTVRDYAERWLRARAPRLKPSTAARYADDLATKILPHFGEIYIDAVTRTDVEEWVSWAETVRTRRGHQYSGVTVTLWWRMTQAFLRDASAEFGLPDPTNRVRPPDRRTKGEQPRERRTLTLEQLADFLALIKADNPHWYVELAMLAYTGMRVGELHALRWANVDLDEQVLFVREAVWRGHLGLPKTRDPRAVPLTQALCELLHGHRRQQLAIQHPGLKKGLVFPNPKGGYRNTSSLNPSMSAASEKLGLGIGVTPQVLRRTYNSLLVKAGVDRIVLRSMMGHSSEAMTQRYAGVDLEDKKKAIKLFKGD